MAPRKRTADTAASTDSADTAADNAASVEANLTGDTADMTDASIVDTADAALTDAADAPPAPIENTADGAVELSEVAQAQALIVKLDAALIALAGTAAEAVLIDQRNVALGTLAMAEAEHALQAQKWAEIAQVNGVAASLPVGMLDVLLDAIERKYAPAPSDTAPDAPDTADAPDSGPTPLYVSDRTRAANTAAWADPAMQARAADAYAAFERDSGKLDCRVNRKPNTRFSGMVALAPSSGGVANADDYDRLTRAVRAYLINVKRWKVGERDGQTVPESKWLASAGRYVTGGGVGNARDCFNSTAEIALYPDGQFRFAYAGDNVRFLRTDKAAFDLFVGNKARASTAPVTPPTDTASTATDAAPRAATVPTPPNTIALPDGGLARTARCQHCQTRNVVGMALCQNPRCKLMDWYVA